MEVDDVVLVGTAHVSQRSVDEVREVIQRVQPSVVAVELDADRRDALMDRRNWEETPVTEIIKGGKSTLVLAQAVLSSYQRRIARETGVEPGSEMKAAMEEADAAGAEVVLADRNIGVTLKRAWHHMGFREKLRVAWEMWKALLGVEDEDAQDVDIEEMMEEDVVTEMMEELAAFAPSVSEVLIHERDAYLARRIHEARERADGPIVAVVGAGHLEGVRRYLERPETLPPLEEIDHVPEKRFSVGKLVGWTLTGAIIAVLVLLTVQAVMTQDYAQLGEQLLTFTLITGIPSAIGCALAGGHPLSILTAFLAAPVGVLHPALATGWFAGAVEAWIRTPRVVDFEEIGTMETLKEFRENRLTRVLLVTALTNLGAMVGFFVGGSYLLSRVQETTSAL